MFSSVSAISPFAIIRGNWVEVRTTAAGIRDCKSPERGHLAVRRETFAAFLAGVKAGQYD
jgi:hypothetical protein